VCGNLPHGRGREYTIMFITSSWWYPIIGGCGDLYMFRLLVPDDAQDERSVLPDTTGMLRDDASAGGGAIRPQPVDASQTLPKLVQLHNTTCASTSNANVQ
jgi:hypothetical protein